GRLPDATFKSSAFVWQPGDTLVLFSDGVTEARSPEDEEFSTARLKDVVTRYASAPLQELQGNILNAVVEFTRGAGQADDVTLLLVRYQGAAQPATALAGGM